jgi:choline kinase
MSAFLHAEIKDIVVITGHGSNETCRLLEPWQDLLNIEVVENLDFDRKNLDYSLFCADRYLNEPSLYFEGDLLLPPELLKRLSRASAEVAIAASKNQASERADAVVLRDGRQFLLESAEHGSLEISASEGEFICAVRLGGRAVSVLSLQLSSCDFVGPMRVYDVFSDLMRTHSTELIDASSYPWIEIDNHQDLQHAAAIVERFGFRPPVSRGKGSRQLVATTPDN